jgi:hypothetical protein
MKKKKRKKENVGRTEGGVCVLCGLLLTNQKENESFLHR